MNSQINKDDAQFFVTPPESEFQIETHEDIKSKYWPKLEEAPVMNIQSDYNLEEEKKEEPDF